MNATQQTPIWRDIMPRLEARYSANGLIGRMTGLFGVLLFLVFGCFLGIYKRPTWLTALIYAAIAMLAAMVPTSLYRLLTQRGQVIVSMDAAGFKDIRLTPTVIPWCAIQSLSPHILAKTNKATGVALEIDPAFKRSLAVRLGAKLDNWTNFFFGRSFYVDTRCLDVDCGELSRVAESYMSKTSLSAS
jgi:hypothetical protein